MKTNISHGRRAVTLLLFFALLVSLMTGTSFAASIQDGATTATMSLGHRETILETTAGTRLRACAYTYTTDNGLSGVSYCIDHGLDFTSKTLPITGKYMSSPVTAGVYANGYPQHSLYTFNQLFLADNPILAGLTESEYAYATQLAVWASLGQLGIAGTSFTSGREFIDQPSGDVQQERVFRAVQCLLMAGSEWDRVYQTGAYIRLEENELGGNISIESDMTLDYAAAEEKYGLKRETINGRAYYTREYWVASATSTYYDDYNIEVWADNAPSGTMFTYLNNTELSRGTFRNISTWSTPTAYRVTSLNQNGYEYAAAVKLCIPTDTATLSGEITINMATYPMQYDIFLCENTDDTEQSYIIADPSQGVVMADAVLSWGGIQTETGELEIKKISDTGLPLSGAEFVLTGEDGSSRTGTSDQNGIVHWVELNPRVHYILTETKAPAGYGIAAPIDVTISAAKVNYVTVTDTANKRLTIHKQDKQNGYSLQGCTFRFEQIDGSFVIEKKTDHAGNIQLSAEELPIGSYKVFEKAACDGYELDPTPQTVNWDGLHDITLTFENARKKTLVIYKCDEGNHYALPHATFDFFRNGSYVTSVTTNDAGLAYVTDVTTGYYTARERIAPAGYELSTQEYSVYVDNYDPATTDDPRLVVPNKALPTLRIIKLDRTTLRPMEGISFEVSCDGTSLGTFRTDSAGEIIVTDHAGTFLVKEVETTDTHIVCSDPQQIELHAGDGTRTLYFFNDKKPGMHLVKLDEADLSTPIPNAKFRFEAVDGSWGPQELTTGADGTIDLSRLPAIAMVVTELDCPGYVIDNAQRIIQLKPNETTEFVFTNSKEPALHLKKLSSDGTALAGVSFRLTKIEDGSHYLDRTTDSSGEILWEGLEPGVYSLTETATLSTHILNPREYHVEVFPGKVSEVVIENDVRPNLTVYKKDADTGEAVPNTVFLVKAADGHSVDEIKTDSTGKAELKNLLPGVYEISEKSVPSPYLLDAPAQLVTLYPNRDHAVFFENHQKPTITIKKISSVTGDPIQAAKFHVTYASNNTGTGEINDLGDFYTGEDGTFTLEHKRDGWYKVEELEPSAGYGFGPVKSQEFYLTSGTSKTVTFENVPLSALVVYKFDTVTGAPIPDCAFQLRYLADTSGTGGTVIGTYRTSANGSFTVTGLKAGTYIAEELSSDTHHIIDSAPQTAYLSGKDQDVVTLYFGNTPKGNLLVRKVDAISGAPLPDVEFTVTTADGAVVGNTNGKYVTDSTGSFLIEGLAPGTSLIVTEARAKSGYVLDNTPQVATVRPGQTVSLEFRNSPKGNLIIEKYDKVTKQPLSGGRFKITTASGEYLTDNEGLTSTNGLYTTDNSGQIVLSNVTPSTIVVTEIEAPANYRLDPTPQTVVVTAGSTETLRFYDDPLCYLTIHKRDSATKKPLEKAELFVTYSDGTIIGPNGGKYVTGKDGSVIVTGLTPEATVSIVEQTAPKGYVLDRTPRTTVVHSGVANSVTVDNEPGTTLKIHKYIDGTANEPLAGVGFTLTDGNGGNVGPDTVYYTDKTGTITLTGLEPGITVKAQEVKTVEGFVLDGTPQTIQIKAGEEQELTFWNRRAGALHIVKLDSVTKERISGAVFEVRNADGRYVDQSGGRLSSNGRYTTNRNGEIVISGLTGTVVVTELEPAEGYTIDEANRSQTVVVNPNDSQTLTFYNAPVGGVEIIKVSAADKTQRIPNTTFEIRRMDGGLVTTATTGTKGRVYRDLDAGDYYAVETEAGEGFKLDPTPTYFMVENGKTTTLTITNQPFSGITIHKIDAVTGKGIYGVRFTVYDGKQNPIDEVVTDQNGYAYVEGLTQSGRYYLRELEHDGYLPDTQLKSVTVRSGETTEVTWKNTPITGQIQITKTSADYNSMNGWPAGSPIPNTVFEIYDRAGNVVDTIQTGKNGVAVTRPLPLGRYQAVEYKSADHYLLDRAPIDLEIEFPGQIVKAAMTNRSLYTNVSITKRGYGEVMPGQTIRYDFSNIANNSTTALESFYWRDALPTNAVRLDKIVTGTWSAPGNYKIVYRTNLTGGEYRVLADNLATGRNYVLNASPAALSLASNEYVTEFMAVFGVVPASFRQVEAPQVYCAVLPSLMGGTEFTNTADAGGVYNGQWIMAADRWVTRVYAPSKPLPRTGY